MINWQTGEITLPELTLHPGTTAEHVLTVMRDKVKPVQMFKFDKEEYPDEENELLAITLFMSEPPVIAEKLTLEALEFDPCGNLMRYVLSPTDIGDDDWGEEFRKPVEARLEEMALAADGVRWADYPEDTRYESLPGYWQFPWGSIDYDDDHLIDVYIRHETFDYSLIAELENESDESKLLHLFNTNMPLGYACVESLAKCDGEFVNITYKFPGGACTTLCNNDTEYYIAMSNGIHGEKLFCIADETFALMCEMKDQSPEVVFFKKWR